MEELAVVEALATIRTLFGTDFDGTLTEGNTQVAILMHFGHTTEEELTITKKNIATYKAYWDTHENECWEVVKTVPLIATPERLRNVFRIIAEAGHFHVLMSFNIFGDRLIPRFLKEIIGLEETFIQQHVELICFWPFDSPFDKNLHLELGKILAKKKLGLTHDIPNRHIVFTDDDHKRNIPRASRAGYTCILATHKGTHLQEMIDASESIKKPEEEKEESESSSARSLGASMEGAIFRSGGTPYSSPGALRRSPCPDSESETHSLRSSLEKLKH